MSRPTGDDPKGPSNTTGEGQNRRRTRRRRRTILNLGMPFVQVDDFLNQSEDAVALGYRVLEDTVKEIQKGYEEAKEFNFKQRNWDGKGPAPSIPWEQLVERVQGFQNIAFRAVTDGTAILFDSIRSGTDAMKSAARTWEQTGADVEAKPVLAGPVFESPIEITATAGGDRPKPVVIPIRHRGLARLRIHAVLDPPLKELQPTGGDISRSGTLGVEKVSFEPASQRSDEETSVLTIDIGKIGKNQTAAWYEGLIRADNFELLIARLRVSVVAHEERATPRTEPKKRPVTTQTRLAGTYTAQATTKAK